MEELTSEERAMLAQALKSLAVTFPPEWAVGLGYVWANLTRKLGVLALIQSDGHENDRARQKA